MIFSITTKQNLFLNPLKIPKNKSVLFYFSDKFYRYFFDIQVLNKK